MILGIRPEDLEDAALETDVPADRRCAGGSSCARRSAPRSWPTSRSRARTPRRTRRASSPRDSGAEGTEKQIGAEEDEAVVVGRFGARSRIKVGEEVTAVVDTRALHFFDPETGTGIYDGTTPSTKGAPS